MARGSVSRKVARAAKAGSGRTKKSQTPLGYSVTLATVVALGLATVAFSRYQLSHGPGSGPPTLQDHWHAAFAFDICGKIQPNPPQNPNVSTAGLHTHGDGLIHVEPLSSSDTGHNANLGHFVKLYPGMALSATSLRYPGQRTWRNGDKCGSRPGKVEVEVWTSLAAAHGRLVTGNPDSLLIENGELITMAFVAPGTSIPKPPSKSALATVNSTATTSTTAPPATKTRGPLSTTRGTSTTAPATSTTAKGTSARATTTGGTSAPTRASSTTTKGTSTTTAPVGTTTRP